jgi:hypothetical protein
LPFVVTYLFKGIFVLFLIDEGYYQGGKFQFETEVPDAYNMVVSNLHWNLVFPHPVGCLPTKYAAETALTPLCMCPRNPSTKSLVHLWSHLPVFRVSVQKLIYSTDIRKWLYARWSACVHYANLIYLKKSIFCLRLCISGIMPEFQK